MPTSPSGNASPDSIVRDLLRVQVRAVRVETFGEPPHRAFHRPVDLHFLDVVVQDERHDVVEYPQVL